MPSSLNNIPLDYGSKELDTEGCFLGSAAVVVLSDKDNMMEVGLNLLKFKNLNRLIQNKKFTTTLIQNVACIYTFISKK